GGGCGGEAGRGGGGGGGEGGGGVGVGRGGGGGGGAERGGGRWGGGSHDAFGHAGGARREHDIERMRKRLPGEGQGFGRAQAHAIGPGLGPLPAVGGAGVEARYHVLVLAQIGGDDDPGHRRQPAGGARQLVRDGC